MNVKTVDDLRRMLQEIGYSDDATNEILKWYEQNNTERRA